MSPCHFRPTNQLICTVEDIMHPLSCHCYARWQSNIHFIPRNIAELLVKPLGILRFVAHVLCSFVHW
nr:MAG TPA: hypothetical protein [Caudoviricetes sp.]